MTLDELQVRQPAATEQAPAHLWELGPSARPSWQAAWDREGGRESTMLV